MGTYNSVQLRTITYKSVQFAGLTCAKMVPHAISELMETSSERALTIRPRKFNLTTLRNLSPIEFITESWNKIPIEIKRTSKLQSFKELLRKNIISKY